MRYLFWNGIGYVVKSKEMNVISIVIYFLEKIIFLFLEYCNLWNKYIFVIMIDMLYMIVLNIFILIFLLIISYCKWKFIICYYLVIEIIYK